MTGQDLNPGDILMHEFDYAAETATQANEDRVKVFNYFLVVAGTVIASIFTVAEKGTQNSAMAYPLIALFIVLFALGVLSLINLARLRKAWVGSAKAMCQIKEFYIDRINTAHPDLKIDEAFAWRLATVPRPEAPSIAGLLAYSISLISSLSLAATIIFYDFARHGAIDALAVLAALLVFAIATGVQIWYWKVLCTR